MKKIIVLGTCFSFLLSAHVALAAVRINEVAWMGTTVSGSNEWIELYNDSAGTVDLSGWHIAADDGSPIIALSGGIAPNGFYLIERTDDTTVSDVVADLVAAFGNGLSNSGETLRLKDGNSIDIDVVVGGTDWQNIGGDNTTKQTAQRSGTSWITDTPTPRAQNSTQNNSQGEVAGASTTTSAQSVSTSGSSGSSSSFSSPKKNVYPRTEMTVVAGDDRSAFTGFPVAFSGNASGLYDEPLPNATYHWNFGDGATGEGKNVTHIYRFPGEYVVTLNAFYGGRENTDRLSVLVSTPDIVISRAEGGVDGRIELANRSSREIDCSGFVLRSGSGAVLGSGTSMFIFPPHTVMLPGKSLLLPNSITGLLNAEIEVALFSPTGRVIHSFSSLPLSEKGTVKGASVIKESSVRTNNTAMVLNKDATKENAEQKNSSTTESSVLWQGGNETQYPAATGALDLSASMKWFFGIAGLVLIALAAFILIKGNTDDALSASHYTIIEDIIEGEEDGKVN